MHLLRRLPVLLLAISGCSTHVLRVPVVGPIPNVTRLIEAVNSQTDSLRDMRVIARIHLRIDGVKQKGAAVLFYRAPNRLKIDIKDTLLGIGVISAKSNRDSIEVYLPRGNRFLSGYTEETLHAITGMNLGPFDTYSAILGLSNLSPMVVSRVTAFENRGDSLFVEIIAPLWTHHLWFDGQTATLLKEVIFAPDGVLLTQRLMSEYERVGDVVLPRKIRILQGDARIEIRVTERVINSQFPDSRFEMRIPSDVIPLGLSH